MAHLIKLELKKFGVIRNTCFTIAVILFCILFITVSLVDSMTDPEQTKDSFESTFLVIGLLMLRTWIPMAAITVIICTLLSLWPFIIGMIRKSVPAAFITSLCVIFLRQLLISKNSANQESLPQLLLIALITVLSAVFIFQKKVPELY